MNNYLSHIFPTDVLYTNVHVVHGRQFSISGIRRQCYMEIPSDHPWALSGLEMHTDDVCIDVHGGITYWSDSLPSHDKKADSVFIGWDYWHTCCFTKACDYADDSSDVQEKANAFDSKPERVSQEKANAFDSKPERVSQERALAQGIRAMQLAMHVYKIHKGGKCVRWCDLLTKKLALCPCGASDSRSSTLSSLR